MDRKETTKFLGQLLINTRFRGAGKHWASEVSIDPWGREAKRVDYMQFSPADQCSISGIEKGIFTCYEIKSCKEDVYSGNGLNFLGEKNYIVTTMECYKDILPDLSSGKFARHMSEQFPESSNYFGVMVAIPDWVAMNRIPIVISVSGKGNRFACDKCYEKSQREKEYEKTEL